MNADNPSRFETNSPLTSLHDPQLISGRDQFDVRDAVGVGDVRNATEKNEIIKRMFI